MQTPLLGAAADGLRIGDRVWFRHAKAGELCERFNELHLIDGHRGHRHRAHLPRRGTGVRLTRVWLAEPAADQVSDAADGDHRGRDAPVHPHFRAVQLLAGAVGMARRAILAGLARSVSASMVRARFSRVVSISLSSASGSRTATVPFGSAIAGIPSRHGFRCR